MSKEIKLITKDVVKSLLPVRKADSNKGTFGKVLNIAGCANYQGAAYLSSVSPLKVGAGLVTLASIGRVVDNLSSNTPWVTFLPLKDYKNKCITGDAFDDLRSVIGSYNVISIGCGLSDLPAVSEFVVTIFENLSNTDKNVVIDADALNIIAKLQITKLPQNAVITPHPMEMARLMECSIEEIQNDRVGYAKKAVEKYGCTVVLKGHKTIVATKNGEVWQNTSGNSALAKAGSGDVLTGMISGFLAQGLQTKDAAILGVYLHGLCGEIASNHLTEYSVMATDQIDYISEAIKTILPS